jgi:hypothetical protein
LNWLLVLIAISASEHLAHGFISNDVTWELALGAKYLSLAVVLQLLLAETKHRPLLFRSIVALFCVGAWVDFGGHIVWRFSKVDSSIPIMVGFSLWLVNTAKRSYSAKSDSVNPENIYILFHRPKTAWGVIKALVGFSADSVSVYAKGQAWSFRRNSGTFSLYSAGSAVLSANIAVDTGKALSPDVEEALDNLVGQPRFPCTKCVWAIRHVLRKLGGKFAPRWCDYIPGIYAMRIIKGRG